MEHDWRAMLVLGAGARGPLPKLPEANRARLRSIPGSHAAYVPIRRRSSAFCRAHALLLLLPPRAPRRSAKRDALATPLAQVLFLAIVGFAASCSLAADSLLWLSTSSTAPLAMLVEAGEAHARPESPQQRPILWAQVVIAAPLAAALLATVVLLGATDHILEGAMALLAVPPRAPRVDQVRRRAERRGGRAGGAVLCARGGRVAAAQGHRPRRVPPAAPRDASMRRHEARARTRK